MPLKVTINCCGNSAPLAGTGRGWLTDTISRAKRLGKPVWVSIYVLDSSQRINMVFSCGSVPASSAGYVSSKPRKDTIKEKEIKELWKQLGCDGDTVDIDRVSDFLQYFHGYILSQNR